MMNVLCLYNHKEYGAPMERSADYFDAHGISMNVVHCEKESMALYHIADGYDCILWQSPPMYESVVKMATPVIILERVDGAQLRLSREWLPRVAGVIKSYLFRDRDQYNWENDRAHIRLLHEAGIQCTRPLYREGKPQPQLCQGDLDKLRVGYTAFGAHQIMEDIVKESIDFDAERPYDLCFMGTVGYQGTEVESHRMAALEATLRWSGRSFGRTGRGIPRANYHEIIRQSKAVLCPWGWGEATYRDYEAMALGAVMVKPASDYVESWPDIYASGTYIPCDVDFSHSRACIAAIARDWPACLGGTRRRAHQCAVDAWNPELIAAHMAKQIRSLLA